MCRFSRTIVVFSIVYMIGHLLLTVGTFFNTETSSGMMLLRISDYGGLLIIALANGGLKASDYF